MVGADAMVMVVEAAHCIFVEKTSGHSARPRHFFIEERFDRALVVVQV